jgi:hypothetical protein
VSFGYVYTRPLSQCREESETITPFTVRKRGHSYSHNHYNSPVSNMARSRCANHFRQCFLRYLGDQCLRLVVLSVASQQKKSASEPFLGRIKELIDYPFVSGTP